MLRCCGKSSVSAQKLRGTLSPDSRGFRLSRRNPPSDSSSNKTSGSIVCMGAKLIQKRIKSFFYAESTYFHDIVLDLALAHRNPSPLRISALWKSISEWKLGSRRRLGRRGRRMWFWSLSTSWRKRESSLSTAPWSTSGGPRCLVAPGAGVPYFQ